MTTTPCTAIPLMFSPGHVLIDDRDLNRLLRNESVVLFAPRLGRYHGEGGHVRVRLIDDERGSATAALVDLVACTPSTQRVEFIDGNQLDLRRENLRLIPKVAA